MTGADLASTSTQLDPATLVARARALVGSGRVSDDVAWIRPGSRPGSRTPAGTAR